MTTAEYNHSALLFYQYMEMSMTTDTALIEKREDLKRRLAAGEYKTLVDVLFDKMSRVIQRLIRSSRPISAWVNGFILFTCINMHNLQFK